MNKRQFRQYMLKGRGCCVQAVRADPERWRSEVLWACGHEIAFDAQCEGSRAWYVYQMIRCYRDKSPFLNQLIAAMDKSRSTGGWKTQYLGEILVHFMLDGSKEAEAALWQHYEALYAMLRKQKRHSRRYFFERDDFAALCQDLGERREAMVKIAEDIGRLYREKTMYDGWCFDWLYATNGKRILKTLEKLGEKNENIAAYLRESRRTEAEDLQQRQNRKPSAAVTGSRLKQGSREEQLEYMNRYLAEKDLQDRADALRVFVRCPYPGDIGPVAADMYGEDPNLRFVAGLVLENLRSPQVRQLALEKLDSDPETWFPMLVRNYEERDRDFVAEYVKSMKTDHACTTAWHGIQLDVLKMLDHGLKAPGELLLHIYETTYCSNCRCEALRQLGKRRMLTDRMLEEALYDSQADVRAYAKRLLRSRSRE